MAALFNGAAFLLCARQGAFSWELVRLRSRVLQAVDCNGGSTGIDDTTTKDLPPLSAKADHCETVPFSRLIETILARVNVPNGQKN